jgi:hypothetical protein
MVFTSYLSHYKTIQQPNRYHLPNVLSLCTVYKKHMKMLNPEYHPTQGNMSLYMVGHKIHKTHCILCADIEYPKYLSYAHLSKLELNVENATGKITR